jgi:F-type H+-transporting ATPase subunit alpha
VLLALTARLFDPIPLDEMGKAVRAVQQAAATIPEELLGRFASADTLSEADRDTVVDMAREALASLESGHAGGSEAEPSPDPHADPDPDPDPDPGPGPRSKVDAENGS